MRASSANAQSGCFVDAAVGFDDDKAATAAVERNGHRITEQRPAHEREPPSEPLERAERCLLWSRQALPQCGGMPGIGLSSTLAAKHGGNSSKRARSVDQTHWLRPEAVLSVAINVH